MACGNWSRIDLKAGPDIAYVAIPRAGSGTLRALLRKLSGRPMTDIPHDHTCTLRELLATHRARRVLVPLRPLHERIVSYVERSRRRSCRPPAWMAACVYPPVFHFMPASKARYLDAAAERFVNWLRSDVTHELPFLMQPTSTYLNATLVPNDDDDAVRFVCTRTLRRDVARTLRRWEIPDAKSAWDGVTNRHVTNTHTRLSNASLRFLRTRYAEDYELVERHGCGA